MAADSYPGHICLSVENGNMSQGETFDFFIQWHLTDRCNLHCRHCYQTSRNHEELSFQEIRDVVDEVSSMLDAWSEDHEISFSPSFSLTGGEPFLRPDLFEIIGLLIGRGFEVFLLSNGTLITLDNAKSLKYLGVSGVQVSMEGPESVHNAIRGKGSYAAASRGVKHLLDAGLEVTLNVTLSRLNALLMPDMVSVASRLGVQRLGFSRLVPAGRGRDLASEMLDKDQVRNIYSTLLQTFRSGLDLVTGDPIAAQINLPVDPDRSCTALGGCAAGVSGLTLLPDGTITPCRRLHVPLGNIRKDSLREIWATSEVLNALRTREKYKGKCGSCPRWSSCRGCRAIAYAASETTGAPDFLAEDPQCFIED